MAGFGSKAGRNRKSDNKNKAEKKTHNKNQNQYQNQKDGFYESERGEIRKQVDPETTEYFTRIANLLAEEIELEERTVLCGNALEETRGKESQLANDYIISHTLQTLLEGCDVHHLCAFLQGCGNSLACIATDRSGSHVIETALRSLAYHLQNDYHESHTAIQDALTKICEVIVVNPVHIMCSRYGSHVLRSLLCVCKGTPLDSLEGFHVTKSATVLSGRLNTKAAQSVGDNLPQQGFLDLLKFLVKEMLKYSRKDIATLQVDQCSSLVLQTALKLLAGEDQDLMHIIPILLGCSEEAIIKDNFLEISAVKKIVNLLKDNAFSHLMEVILEVAPETLLNEMFLKIFKNSLFRIASNHCGSFVIQALVSSARCQGQMDVICDELGGKFKELVEIGKSGVVASILAASLRLRSHEQKCCQALAAAVHSTSESPNCIVPRLLSLESYIFCEDKSAWKWAKGDKKMHVLGCLMLQTVFKFPSEVIQSYVTSITSMDADHVLETAKDAGGGRVIESFLDSGVSAKQKRRLIAKLRGNFGELSMYTSSSFTVEKCFTCSSVSLKESIASELLDVRDEVSRTKQGPYLLRKLDIDGFGARRDEWRLRQESKQNAYKEFYAAFGPAETKSSEGDKSFCGVWSKDKRPRAESPPTSVKKLRKEIDGFFGCSTLGSVFSGHEKQQVGSNKYDNTMKRKTRN